MIDRIPFDRSAHLQRVPTPRPEFSHNSLRIVDPDADAIEHIWLTFWQPLFTDPTTGRISKERMKGELFEIHHLIMNAPKVYHHVTGGLTDAAGASAEGIIAAAEAAVARRIEVALNGAIARLAEQHNGSTPQ